MHRALLLVIGLVVCLVAVPVPAASQVPASPPAPTGPPGSAAPPSPDGWVVLPLDEYRALRARGLPPPPPPAAAPVDATLTRVDYELRVDSEAIAGRALLTIDVLREGWARVQIPAGLMARDARVDSRPVPIVEGPPPQVLLSRTGRTVIALDIAMPLTTAGGTESVVIPASAAPIARATLLLPRSGVDLSVTGGFIAERGESPDASRWTMFGHPGQPLTVSWKRKVDDRRADQPLRTRARVITLVGLGEDVSPVTSSVRVEVVQGLMREIALAAPATMAINQVHGSTVADWEASSGTLRVRLLDATGSEAEFVVQGEVRLAREGEVAVPLVRVPSAERETGGVAIDVVGAGEVAGRQARGLDPTDPSELGEIVAGRESPSMLAYRLRPLAGADARSLSVSVVRYTPQAVLIANVEEARYRALAAEDGAVLVEARYAVRNNQRSFLKVAMPPGAQVWSAKVSGRPIRPGLAEPDALLLPLEKGRAGDAAPTFAVELMFLQRAGAWADKGIATIALPSLDLPVSRTGLELRYSPRYRVTPVPGAFRVEDDPGPTAEAFQPTGRVGVTVGGTAARPSDDALQQLADRFRSESGGRVAVGALPVTVTFPAFGPSMFLASELTAEERAPVVELSIRRVTK